MHTFKFLVLSASVAFTFGCSGNSENSSTPAANAEAQVDARAETIRKAANGIDGASIVNAADGDWLSNGRT